jgi:hypothetical protein
MGAASRAPRYPTIPHMVSFSSRSRWNRGFLGIVFRQKRVRKLAKPRHPFVSGA